MSIPATQSPTVDPAVQTALKNQHVYLLFAKEVGPLVKAKYPTIQKVQFNQILGRIWNEMPPSEREKYHQKAEYQQNQHKLAAGELQPNNIKKERVTLDQVSSESAPTVPVQEQPASNVYAMEIPNNGNVKRIFLQRVDNSASSSASPLPQQSNPFVSMTQTSVPMMMQNPYQMQPPLMQPSPQPAQLSQKMYKPIMPKDSNPQDVMKQYPMFPMYFKNMYATLKKIYSDKSDEELKLRAFAMFQEMLLTDRQYYKATTVTKPIPEPVHHAPESVAMNMPVIMSSTSVPVMKSVTPPPPMQQSPKPSPKTESPRGSSAYNYFTQEMHPIVYAQYSNLKATEVNKLLGKMWSKMTEVEKSKYCQMANIESFKLAENLARLNKTQVEDKTENLVFREEDVILPKVNPPVEKDPLEEPVEQAAASEPEPTLEESAMVTQNEIIADEYQITIKQEPITEELDAAPAIDTNTSDDLSAENSMQSSEVIIAVAPITIKSERIESEEFLASPMDTSECPDAFPKPSVNTEHCAGNDSEGSKGENNSEPSAEDAPEQEDPKTQVIFHNLDFFIKSESATETETSTDAVELENLESIETAESKTAEPSKQKEQEKEGIATNDTKNDEPSSKLPVPSFSSQVDHSSYTKKVEKSDEDDHSSYTKNADKSDTKDELKSLIGALVSKRTPDKKVISKIVTKTRVNLTESEAPAVPSHPAQVLYCYCRSPVSKNLIGCDFCPEWFHPKCLGLSKYELKMVLSLSNWKCPECIKSTDGDKKTLKSRTPNPQMHQSLNPVSPKNKTPPVTHTSPPIKARRLSTNEKAVATPETHTNKELHKPVAKVDTPEIVSETVKHDSKPKCDTCHILVEEVKRRGETIERMARRIQMLENNSSKL